MSTSQELRALTGADVVDHGAASLAAVVRGVLTERRARGYADLSESEIDSVVAFVQVRCRGPLANVIFTAVQLAARAPATIGADDPTPRLTKAFGAAK